MERAGSLAAAAGWPQARPSFAHSVATSRCDLLEWLPHKEADGEAAPPAVPDLGSAKSFGGSRATFARPESSFARPESSHRPHARPTEFASGRGTPDQVPGRRALPRPVLRSTIASAARPLAR